VELRELAKIQAQFSREKFPHFWRVEGDRDAALRLEYLTNALASEVGELANVVKKVLEPQSTEEKASRSRRPCQR